MGAMIAISFSVTFCTSRICLEIVESEGKTAVLSVGPVEIKDGMASVVGDTSRQNGLSPNIVNVPTQGRYGGELGSGSLCVTRPLPPRTPTRNGERWPGRSGTLRKISTDISHARLWRIVNPAFEDRSCVGRCGSNAVEETSARKAPAPQACRRDDPPSAERRELLTGSP